MASGDGAGSWKRDPSRVFDIMILHLAWEILLSAPVGQRVGEGPLAWVQIRDANVPHHVPLPCSRLMFLLR